MQIEKGIYGLGDFNDRIKKLTLRNGYLKNFEMLLCIVR